MLHHHVLDKVTVNLNMPRPLMKDRIIDNVLGA